MMDDAARIQPKKPRVRRAPAPTTADPIEIAMEAEAQGGGAASDTPAHRLLLEQGQLVRWQIASERAGLGLKVLTGAAGVAAAVILGVMAWNASRDASLVIDPVSAPEDLVRDGATGPALAHALQDKLVQLQADTQAPLLSAQVREKDGGGLKVQIPGSGVSLADLDLALRQALGHQTHLSAEISRVNSGPEKGGLALTARLGAKPGVRLVQADGDLDALIGKAAEYAYRAAEPIKYSAWLTEHDRIPEAVELLKRLTGVGSDMERAQAWFSLSDATQLTASRKERRDMQAEAVRLSKGRIGLNNFAVSEGALGHAEAAYRAFVQLAKQGGERRSNLTEDFRVFLKVLPYANAANARGDYNGSFILACTRMRLSPCNTASILNAVRADPALADGVRENQVDTAAQLMANLHDLPSAEALYALRPAPTEAKTAQKANQEVAWLSTRLVIDREREDWVAVLRDVDAWEALAAKWPALRIPYNTGSSRGLALAALGDKSGAEAAAAILPLDCYRCLMRRGQIAAMLGQAAQADRWYAEAVRQGPSLPLAEAEWARVLLKQGRIDAALVQAAAAARKSPRFADAHEVWGEALLAKGDAKAAVARFEAAARLAPQWGRLHLKWGEALAKLGKGPDAKAEFGKAAGLFLTAAERAELARMQEAK